MSAIPKQEYMEYYRKCEERRYRDFLDSLSDNISFESDKWICEKRLKNQSQLSEQGHDLFFDGSRAA